MTATRARRRWAAAFVFASAVGMGGCTYVEPWERGTLARRDMSFEPAPALAALRAQISESKEAAGAGSGGKAGGCGCN